MNYKIINSIGIWFFGFVNIIAQPNIIFFLIDDMGWTDVGYIEERYYTPSYYETPNINQLAKEGMEFTNGYANAPNCAPSRAAIISGQYAPRTGIYTVWESIQGKPENRKLIPPKNTRNMKTEVFTVAEALKTKGYATISIGKWHLGQSDETGPLGQGFDVNIGGNTKGGPGHGGYFCPYNSLPNLDVCDTGEYLTDREADEAIKFITENKDNPFFVYLPHYAIHVPHEAKDSITALFEDKPPSGTHKAPVYASMISSVDYNLGRIMKSVKDLGLESNTVVVFFSDNGGAGRRNVPLRAGKGSLYEGGIREPLLIKWPGVTVPGSVCDVPVIGVDFFPTFVDMAGASIPNDKVLDGESLVPLLNQSGPLKRQHIFWHLPVYLSGSSNNSGEEFYYYAFWRTTPAGAIRKGDYKLMEFFEYGQLELYNIKEDMSETTNLALQMPGKVYELRNAMYAWRDRVKAPVPVELNPEYTGPPPTNYVTYEDIQPLLKFGCLDSDYVEYDTSANAHDSLMCQSTHASHKKEHKSDIRVEQFHNNISVSADGEYTVVIEDLQGRSIVQVAGKNKGVYRFRESLDYGIYILRILIKNEIAFAQIIYFSN